MAKKQHTHIMVGGTHSGPDRKLVNAADEYTPTEKELESFPDKFVPIELTKKRKVPAAELGDATEVTIDDLEAFLEKVNDADQVNRWYQVDSRSTAEPIYEARLEALGFEFEED